MLCLKRVNLFDTCCDETLFCLLIFRSDNPLLRSNYRKILYLKNKSRFSISSVKWTSKPESRQCNEKADNLRPIKIRNFGRPVNAIEKVQRQAACFLTKVYTSRESGCVSSMLDRLNDLKSANTTKAPGSLPTSKLTCLKSWAVRFRL